MGCAQHCRELTMGCSRIAHGLPMCCPAASGLSVVCPRAARGPRCVSTWDIGGMSALRVPIDCPCVPHGLCIGCPWIPRGLSVVRPWVAHGLSVGRPCVAHGRSVECPWVDRRLSTSYPWHVVSWELPWGFVKKVEIM